MLNELTTVHKQAKQPFCNNFSTGVCKNEFYIHTNIYPYKGT